MNLLIINEGGITGGGAENRIRLLVKQLVKNNKVIVLQFKENAPLIEKNLKIFCCPKNGIRAYTFVKQIIKKEQIDIVQFHNLPFISPITASKELKIPTIFFAHDYWPICGYRSFIPPYIAAKKKLCHKSHILKCIKCIGLRSYFRVFSYKNMVNLTDIGIAPGYFVKEMYEKHDVLRNKWKIVKPWLNIKPFLKKHVRKRNKDIIFLGSLIEYKGAYLAVTALKYVNEKIPKTRLKLIGTDQEQNNRFRKKIEKLAGKMGVLDKIDFLGKLPPEKIVEVHKKAGVYVCPTVCMELFGQNWAEAMAAGCPVIGSDAGSLPEFIKGYGSIVPSKNPKALANAVINILTDKKLANKLSRDGISYIKQFNVKNAVNKMIQIYQELLAKQFL